MSNAVIQALKTVKERLPDNYTSGQLFDVLDKMLYRAVGPLITNTRYVDRILSIVLAWYAQNHRRRISSLSKKRLAAYILAFLSESDPKRRVLLFRKMRLERNITFFLVTHWLQIIEPWMKLHVSACKGDAPRSAERELLVQCCVISPSQLWGTICQARYWLAKAIEFKDMMIEKYMRLVMMDAVTHYTIQREKNPQLQLDLGELAQNFLLAVIKAIDKFDANQGTLTANVHNWLKNARISQQFRGEYGLAYTIPHSKKTSIARASDKLTRNISVSIDSPEAQAVEDDRDIEGSLARRQELAQVREVAKASDPLGVGRLLLGIPEVLTEYELQQLHAAKV